MRTEQLGQIIEIANKKSISEAARSLGISQSQLSHSLKSLETELGYSLFRRNYTGLIHTSQGKEVLKLAREILDHVEEIKMIDIGGSEVAGSLRLLLEPAVFNAYQAKILMEFNHLHPKINLMVTEHSAESVIPEISTNPSFLGVTGWFMEEDATWKRILDRRNMACEELFQDRIALITGRNHPLVNNDPIKVAELEGAIFIDYCHVGNVYLRALGLKGAENQSILVYNREVLKMLLAENAGIALLPRFFFDEDLYVEQGLLAIREVTEALDPFMMYLVYSREEPLKYGARQLIKILKQILNTQSVDLMSNETTKGP